MQQRQLQRPKRKAVRRTVMEWIVLATNVVPALLLTTVLRDIHHPVSLIGLGVLSGTVGFWGTSISLLTRARKVAALFELLAALGWWCAVLYLIQHLANPLEPRGVPFLSGLVLIGLFLTWLASWLWRFQEDTDEAR